MLTHNSQPITNFPKFPRGTSVQTQRLIAALLIMEHGLESDIRTSSKRLRSPIFLNGGFGNVVVSVTKRPADVTPNKFTSVPLSQLPADSIAVINKFESRYGIDVTSSYRWTGKAASSRMYTYMVFASFSDYVRYFVNRFNIIDGKLPSDLDAILASYSGNVPGYPALVRSIMRRVKVIQY